MLIETEENPKDKDLEDHINEIIKDGYIAEDGTPLKCFCGDTDFEESDQYYEDCHTVEFTLNCKACDKRVGYWAYGSWDILGGRN